MLKDRAVCTLAQEMIFLCAAIRTSNGVAIPWVNELRYLSRYSRLAVFNHRRL